MESRSLQWDWDKRSLGKLVFPRPYGPEHVLLLWSRLFGSSPPQHPLASGN